MRRVLYVLVMALLTGCRESAPLENGQVHSTGPLPEHAVSRSRALLFVDDTIYSSAPGPEEYVEDRRWLEVLGSLQASGPIEFDPLRDIYDVEALRYEPPPAELLFQYATIVWSVRQYTGPSALRQIGRTCDAMTAPTGVLSQYLDDGGELWICGEFPALALGPESNPAELIRRLPACNVNCDDQSGSHNSLLYRMGVECFDVGSHSILRPPRDNTLEHGCRGVRPHPKALGAPLLSVSPSLWPLPVDPFYNPLGTRPYVEIYNVPVFSVAPQPLPRTGALVGYTYVSGVPAGNGVEYPSTADGQPALLLNKREASDTNYSRAFCGFEPWRLTPASHLALAQWVLVHHMGVGGP